MALEIAQLFGQHPLTHARDQPAKFRKDLGNALVLGLREELFARASGVSWLILTFYVPALWVTIGLVVWQLVTRTESRPEGFGSVAGAARA